MRGAAGRIVAEIDRRIGHIDRELYPERVDILVAAAEQIERLYGLLDEARSRIPDWETGVNRDLLARIDAALRNED